MAIFIKQGDAFELPVKIRINGKIVSASDVEAVEFTIGSTRKIYPSSASFSSTENAFLVPLTQQETFAFPADEQVMLDVRVKFKGGKVLGVPKMTPILVYDASSEVVI